MQHVLSRELQLSFVKACFIVLLFVFEAEKPHAAQTESVWLSGCAVARDVDVYSLFSQVA